jgi:hypothetical protein
MAYSGEIVVYQNFLGLCRFSWQRGAAEQRSRFNRSMPSKNARPELTPEYVAHLLVNGYTDEVRRFTQGIQANRRFVLELGWQRRW